MITRYKGPVFNLLHQSFDVFLQLLRIIVPISFVLRLLSFTPFLSYLARSFEPVMGSVGLPGSLAIVLVTTLLTNLYGGMIVLSTLSFSPELTVAQLSILASGMLFVHNLPVELKIGQLSGVSMPLMLGLRLGCAYVYTFICHHLFSITGWLSTTPVIQPVFSAETTDTSWLTWTLNELLNYGKIGAIIVGLMVMMRALDYFKISDVFKWLMRPVLSLLRVSKDAARLIVLGWMLGLAYGGVLIAKEAKQGVLSKSDCVISILLLSLSHALLEDTGLMMLIGGSFWVIFVGRNLFVIVVMTVVSRVVHKRRTGVV